MVAFNWRTSSRFELEFLAIDTLQLSSLGRRDKNRSVSTQRSSTWHARWLTPKNGGDNKQKGNEVMGFRYETRDVIFSQFILVELWEYFIFFIFAGRHTWSTARSLMFFVSLRFPFCWAVKFDLFQAIPACLTALSRVCTFWLLTYPSFIFWVDLLKYQKEPNFRRWGLEVGRYDGILRLWIRSQEGKHIEAMCLGRTRERRRWQQWGFFDIRDWISPARIFITTVSGLS